jgi:hypothetical protein
VECGSLDIDRISASIEIGIVRDRRMSLGEDAPRSMWKGVVSAKSVPVCTGIIRFGCCHVGGL